VISDRAIAELENRDLDSYLDELCGGRLTSDFARNIANVPENPAFRPGTDNRFRIYVPLTAGMDSTTLWQMALESGLPAVPVYMDFGQEVADKEIKAASELANRTKHTLVVFRHPLSFQQFSYILLARNAAAIFLLAQHTRRVGTWGEVWFGNMGDESPVLGGDKSRRFFNDIQALLGHAGYDLRVCNLLMGLDKVDEVTYWRARDLSVLRRTWSCHTTRGDCGACQGCFRKWVAFLAHGIDIRVDFARTDLHNSFDWAIARYSKAMTSPEAPTLYSPARIRSTLAALDTLKDER